MATTKVTTGGITDATIATADIADGAVTDAKIASGISANKITGLATDSITEGNSTAEVLDTGTNGIFRFLPEGSEVFRITHEGKVGIGTSSPEKNLHIENGSSGSSYSPDGADLLIIENNDSVGIDLRSPAANSGNIFFSDANARGHGRVFYEHNNDAMAFCTNGVGSERMRIDSSGRLLIGNSSHVHNGGIEAHLQLIGTGTDDTSIILSRFSNDHHSPYLVFSKSRATNIGDNVVVQNNDSIGRLTFFGNDGTDDNTPAAEIDVEVDGAPGSNDMPGRIVFRTTADGASSVTERMRIDSNGRVSIGNHSGIPNTKFDIGLGVYAASGDDEAADWGADNVFQLTATGGNAANNQVLLVGCHSGGVGQIGSGIGFGRDSTTNWGTYLSFKTHPTSTSNIDQLREVMRIGSDGRTSITTNSSYGNRLTDPSSSADDLVISGDNDTGLTIYTNNTSSKSNIYFADSADADVGRFQYLHNNNQFRLYVNANGTPVMQWNHDLTIYFNGNMYSNGNSYSTGSDLRLKSNLVRFTNTLDNLKKLTGYKFDIKCGENRDSTRKSAGVIAQDVEKVYPELVEEVDGYKHLEYSAFTGILVEAVKELTTKVETLETKVAALTA